MQESLVGRPTSEVVTDIAQTQLLQGSPLQYLYLIKYYCPNYSFDAEGPEPIMHGLQLIEAASVLDPHWLDNAKNKLGADRSNYMGVVSRVLGRDSFGHIPMIDFDFKGSKGSVDSHIEVVKQVLADLCFPNGYIASSGRGFHYFGSRLMTEWGFNNALKQLWKLKKVSGIDKKWIEMAEAQGFFTLRLTSGDGKPQVPTITDLHFLKGRPNQLNTPWNICATRYGAVLNQYSLFDQWELQQE